MIMKDCNTCQFWAKWHNMDGTSTNEGACTYRGKLYCVNYSNYKEKRI